MTVESELEVALKNSWSRETSSDPEHWTPDNPAWGQCAVTALVVNDYLGGEIVRADAIFPDGRWVPHYFNRIENVERDFTRSQFPEGTTIPQGVPKLKGFSSTREYVLSNPMTRQRYEVLKQRVRAFLE